MLAAAGGFNQVAQEALQRLGVNWTPSDSIKAYQKGSTQIPTNTQVIIFERFSCKIATEQFELQLTRG